MTHFAILVVVRHHRHILRLGGCRKGFQRVGNVIAPVMHALHKLDEVAMGKTAALKDRAGPQRISPLGVDRRRVVVESQDADLSGVDPTARLLDRIEIVGLKPKMHARVARQARPHLFEHREKFAAGLQAPQARLPGAGHAVKGSGDAVGRHLSIGIGKCDLQPDMHARPRHDLALEGVAVEIDNARQQQVPLGIDGPLDRPGAIDSGDDTVFNDDAVPIDRSIGVQNARVFDRDRHGLIPTAKAAPSYQGNVTVV